nr:MAG TPA: hypothetical protein [Caudoviricetes sp.]
MCQIFCRILHCTLRYAILWVNESSFGDSPLSINELL